MTTNEKSSLTLGFIPLTDAAPLIVARELGFFQEQGLDIKLQKQNSWATLRDKLHAGILDAAHMLAPMPIASTLGLHCHAVPMITPFVLSLSGNAITFSDALYTDIARLSGEEPRLPLSADSLNAVISERAQKGREKLRFAHVFPYSCHHYQLLDWLKSGGVDLGAIDILTIPPVSMVDALFSGDIDAYCVGGPWNAKAVRSGIGTTVVTSYDIWQDKPEKVVGLTQQFAEQNPNTVIALCAALKKACIWLQKIPNRFEAARMLSDSHYLNDQIDVIAPSLLGSCLVHEDKTPRDIENYNQFFSTRLDVNLPSVERGQWLLEKMCSANQISQSALGEIDVAKIFRADIYSSIDAGGAPK